jgi:hypothetical protein
MQQHVESPVVMSSPGKIGVRHPTGAEVIDPNSAVIGAIRKMKS